MIVATPNRWLEIAAIWPENAVRHGCGTYNQIRRGTRGGGAFRRACFPRAASRLCRRANVTILLGWFLERHRRADAAAFGGSQSADADGAGRPRRARAWGALRQGC